MSIRLTLQPLWAQFLVLSAFLTVFWFCLAWSSVPDTLGNTVVGSLLFGVLLAAATTYGGRTAHRAMVAAVAGLDRAQRAQAIAAVTRGVMPGDPAVRSAAMRLGVAALRGKSAAQLKRGERLTWIVFAAVFVAGCILAALSWSEVRLPVLVLALVLMVGVLSLGVLSTRRTQRNVALLSQYPTAR